MTDPTNDDFQLRSRLCRNLGREPQWWEYTRAARTDALNSRLGEEATRTMNSMKTESWLYHMFMGTTAVLYSLFTSFLLACLFAWVWHKGSTYWYSARVWWIIIVSISSVGAFFKRIHITVSWNTGRRRQRRGD